VEEGFQNQKIDSRRLKQPDLLGDMVASLSEGVGTLALDELGPRDAAGHQGAIARNFLCQANGGLVDLFGLGAVAGAVQFFARAEECQRLENLRTGCQKLAVQLAQRVRLLDGDLRSELAAAAPGADLLAPRAAVDIAAPLEFDQVATVADDRAFVHQFGNRLHPSVSHARSARARRRRRIRQQYHRC
jgi:hypothetical protein